MAKENSNLKTRKHELMHQIEDTENDIKVRTASAESIAQAAYQNKVNELDIKFTKIESDYADKINSFQEEETKLKNELQSLKETRAAAIAAAQQEKIIQENKDFYCLILSAEDQGDVSLLREVQRKLSKPRSVAMCIWSNYYLPIAKEKLPKILGDGDTVCGIYKITNQKTGECYIGQAIDIKKRIYEHMRAACGVDVPSGNQLYAAMQEYGIDNFSIELLLKCSQQELNEKEKYFIELYQSQAYGYNISSGISRGRNR